MTNNAGVTSTFTSAAVAKLTVASPIAVSPGNPAGVYLSGTTLFVGPNAANLPFKLELTTLGQNGVASATWQGKASGPFRARLRPTRPTTSPPFHSGTYTWDGTPGLNDSIQVTRDPSATVDSVSVVSDTNNPTGSISYGAGPFVTHSIHV